MDKPVSVGFVGLGVMGEPMCKNLCRKLLAGAPGSEESDSARELFSISVFDIRPGVADSFSALGANVSETLAGVARESEFILLSLPGGEELQQVLTGQGGIFENTRAGATIVDLSTSPVGLTRELANHAQSKGLQYVDSPVARTRKAAEDGTLAMSVGGESGVVERVRPLLECMASDVLHVGAIGNGQLVKILNNMVLFQTVNALAEAKTLATRSGMDAETLFSALQLGSADSFALQQHGANALLPGNFPEQAFSVAYARKDLRYALDLAESSQTTVAGARHIDDLFDRAMQEGYGEQYWPVISKLVDTGEG